MDFEKFFFSFLFLVHQDLDINKNIMVELHKYLVSSLVIIIHCLYFRFDVFISEGVFLHFSHYYVQGF